MRSKAAKEGVISREVARRLFLGAQGLLADPARPADLLGLVESLGFVQVDSINVLARAHHLTLSARSDAYRPEHLQRLLEEERSLFEHWTHDASAIPTAWFPHWRHRFEPARARIQANAWWGRRLGERAEEIVERVRRRIADEGPLLAQDFDSTERGGEGVGWWSWTPEKAALEYLWHTGVLAVTRRVHFQKVYDLVERVIPEVNRAEVPTREAHVDWACSTALERLGAATPGELAAFWRAVSIPEAKRWCEVKAGEGVIARALLDRGEDAQGGGAVGYAVRDWQARAEALPEAPERLRLLGPFDPVVRDRRRVERLFGFDYRFEAFVPAAKRLHGYYVLPILEGDTFVGRIEPKLLRDEEELQILGLWWEPKVKVTAKRRRALDEALERLAAWLGAKEITGRPTSAPKARASKGRRPARARATSSAR